MLGVYIFVLSVAACIIVGSLVVSRSLRDRTILIYVLLTISFLILCTSNFLAVSMKTDQLLYVRGVMASTTVSLYLIYLLINKLKRRKRNIPIYKSKLFWATAVMFVIDFTDFLFPGVVPGEPPTPIYNYGIILFFGLYLVTLVMGMWQLKKDMSHAQSVNEKRRYALLIAGIVPIVMFAPLTSFVLPNFFGINQFVILTPLYVFIFTSLVGYAIIRHGLFDIRRAVVRTVAYVLSLLSLAGIYYALAYVVSMAFFKGQNTTQVSLSPVNILLAIILSFIFQPIKRFFDRITNDIFYKDEYSSEDFFANLSRLLSSTIDLRGLLERASEEIAATFKSEQAFFFLYYSNAIDHHMSAGTVGHSRMPVHDAKMLDRFVANTSDGIILTDLLEDDTPVKRMLRSHKIALIMPLRQGENIIGYVIMGEHRSGSYTHRDLNVLLAIGDELVIAIQNALSLHEVRELNATLQQRIDVATKELRSSNAQLKRLDEVKDEFMSMASHQLRTPLTSIKGYISMVLEGDAGKVTPQQDRLLQEAFNSSERMVRLINDFLNVSRLQTGKFNIEKAPIDIKAVVRQEIETLQLMAATRGIKLRLNITSEQLPLVADESKIRQVIMNFVDNAIYYSKSDSTIVINLERVKGEVALTVVDTGIGVPEEEQSKLFTKFFRAKNARRQRPDGTGVGLYLARRVISGHGGSVIFSSKEGKGSTFGFKLPLSEKLAHPAADKPAAFTAK